MTPNGRKGKLKQVDREKSLQALMTTNLLKRLESSIESFRLTLKSLRANHREISSTRVRTPKLSSVSTSFWALAFSSSGAGVGLVLRFFQIAQWADTGTDKYPPVRPVHRGRCRGLLSGRLSTPLPPAC